MFNESGEGFFRFLAYLAAHYAHLCNEEHCKDEGEEPERNNNRCSWNCRHGSDCRKEILHDYGWRPTSATAHPASEQTHMKGTDTIAIHCIQDERCSSVVRYTMKSTAMKKRRK